MTVGRAPRRAARVRRRVTRGILITARRRPRRHRIAAAVRRATTRHRRPHRRTDAAARLTARHHHRPPRTEAIAIVAARAANDADKALNARVLYDETVSRGFFSSRFFEHIHCIFVPQFDFFRPHTKRLRYFAFRKIVYVS